MQSLHKAARLISEQNPGNPHPLLQLAINPKSLIEKIKKKAQELEKKVWTIQITWIKAHAGHYGNEMADNLAKEAIKNKETIYNKLPKSQVVQQVKQQSIEKWQNQWDQTKKD